MDKIHDKKEIVKLEEKLGSDYFAGLRVSSESDLKDAMRKLSLDNQVTLQAKKDDIELQDVIERKKDMEKPYSDHLKLIKLKQRAIFLLLQEKGNV